MIPIVSETKVELSDNFKSQYHSIDKDALPHIQKILRKSLYSNPIGSLIREIVANAVDSHISVGKKPSEIEIQVPTDLIPEFSVKDYGVGLSDSQMFGLYSKYGSSTKRDSNDFVGWFGIGKFSPLSYCDSFFVITTDGKKKRIYNIFVDESGLGKIIRMSEEACEEKTSVEVKIAVSPSDISKFFQEIHCFFSFWREKPVFLNQQISFKEQTVFAEGDGWRYIKNGDSRIVMGCVSYPFDVYQIESFDASVGAKNVFSKGFLVEFPIGSLDVSASRESISYSNAVKKTITEKLHSILDKIKEGLVNEIINQPTFFEACALFHEYFGLYGKFSVLRNKVGKIVRNGREIKDNLFEFDSKQINVTEYRKKYSYRRNKTILEKNDIYSSFESKKENNFHYVFNDGVKCVDRRMNKALEKDSNLVFVLIEEAEKGGFDKFKAESGFDAPIINLSSMPYDPIVRRKRNSAPSNGYEFTPSYCDYYSLRSSSRLNKDAWSPVKIDSNEEAGFYVEAETNLVNFCGVKETIRDFSLIIKQFKSFFNIPDLPIYTFSERNLKKVKENENWTKLDDFVKEKYQEYKNSLDNKEEVPTLFSVKDIKEAVYSDGVELKELIKFAKIFDKLEKKNKIASSFEKAFKDLNEEQDKTELLKHMQKVISIDFSSYNNNGLIDIYNNLKKKYPLTNIIIKGYQYFSMSESDLTNKINNYYV